MVYSRGVAQGTRADLRALFFVVPFFLHAKRRVRAEKHTSLEAIRGARKKGVERRSNLISLRVMNKRSKVGSRLKR